MKIIRFNIEKPNQDIIGLFADHLRRGKIIAYPTDTIYGLGCLADNRRAVRRIFKIKRRQEDKPLVVLMGSLAMVRKYCRVDKAQAGIIKEQLSSPAARPTTFILAHKGLLPAELSGNSGNLAIRLPKSGFLRKILIRVKKPIVSTSLNISGRPDLKDLKLIGTYFGKPKPDLVLDAGTLKKKKASRILDIRDVKNIRVLRK